MFHRYQIAHSPAPYFISRNQPIKSAEKFIERFHAGRWAWVSAVVADSSSIETQQENHTAD